MEQLDPRLEGLAFVLPVLRDASLLLLLNRVLRAGQTAAELVCLGESEVIRPGKIGHPKCRVI
jgi:hypothetical protein